MRPLLGAGWSADEGDTTRLSFLDLMSCALGGAILLFVAFMQNSGASAGVPVSDFAATTIEWLGNDNEFDLSFSDDGRLIPLRHSGWRSYGSEGEIFVVFENNLPASDHFDGRATIYYPAHKGGAKVALKWVKRGPGTSSPALQISFNSPHAVRPKFECRDIAYGRWIEIAVGGCG